jgi:hypothetical protein
MKRDSRTRLVLGLVATLMGGCGGDHSLPTAPSLPDALKAGVASVQAQPGTTARTAAANSGSAAVQQPAACQNGPRISWVAEPPAKASTGDWLRGRVQVDPTSGFSLVRQWCDETGPNREWTHAQVEALGYAIDTECPPHGQPGTALMRVVAVPQDQVNCEREIIEARTIVLEPAPAPAPATCPAGQVEGYIATISGTSGGAPATDTRTATQEEVDSYGGAAAWSASLVDLYTIEMEWTDVSVEIEAGCVTP